MTAMLRPDAIGELSHPSRLGAGHLLLPDSLDRPQKRTEVTDFEWPPPRTKLSTEERRACGAELRRRYDDGATIRALMRESSRSFGFVHEVLEEEGTQFRSRGPQPESGLSGRLLQVLRLLADGGTSHTIAAELGIEKHTVYCHLQDVRRRTGVGEGEASDPAAVEAAYVAGVLPSPERLADCVDLPERRRMLIPLLARGLSAEQIASVLKRRVGDVNWDLQVLRRALGASSLAHVITRARQYGFATSSETCVRLVGEEDQ